MEKDLTTQLFWWLVALSAFQIVFFVLAVWAIKVYLVERFDRVCAWCKKVAHIDWRGRETWAYGRKLKHEKTSHSICPDCAEKVREDAGLTPKKKKGAPDQQPRLPM